MSNQIQNPPLAYYATVRNGAMVRRDAPPSVTVTNPVRDDQGRLWVPGALRGSTHDGQYDAIRLNHEGDAWIIRGHGHARLHDGAGSIFLLSTAHGRPPAGVVTIARGDEVVHEATLRNVRSIMSCEASGSIYASHARGIAHITAEAPKDNPQDYHVRHVYWLPPEIGQVRAMHASPHGFLALIVTRHTTMNLYLLPLPLEEEAAPDD